ncbi:MAG: hypothetical protein WEC75_11240 [Dehalococcoidia bacterium]
MLLAILIAKPATQAVDNDFWWHLKTGELIFDRGLIRHDPYSWTAGGHSWVTHEWLSELVIYSVQSTMGYLANVLLFGLVASAALGTMYALGRLRGAGTKPLVVLTLVSVSVLASFMAVRPQLFSWLFFAIFLYVMYSRSEGRRAPIWALPPLMAVWVNLHLGFFYGLMLCAAWVGAEVWDAMRGRSNHLREASVIAAGCLAATMLNPHGPEILWYPLRYLTDAAATHARVSEWLPPTPRQWSHLPILACVTLLAATLASRERPRPFLFIVAVVVGALALQAVRNAPYAALVLLPVAGGALAARWPAASSGRDSRTRVILPLASGLVALAVAIVVGVGSRGAPVAWTASTLGYPVAGTQYVQEHDTGQRLLVEYGWGGYVIHELYPDTKIFVDGRTDFYGNALMENYFTIYDAQPGWDLLLDRYGVEVVLVPKRSRLAAALAEAGSGWTLAFAGDIEVVFERR